MNAWKLLKWLSWGLASSVFLAVLWLVRQFLSEKNPSPALVRLFDVLRENRFSAAGILASLFLTCCLVWLWADFREGCALLARQTGFFLPARRVEPQDFGLVGFHNFYQKKTEFDTARTLLREKHRILVQGRPAAGKTRMAFELARQRKGCWVLRTSADFRDCDRIEVPHRFFSPMHVLWFVDDLDKYVGTAVVDRGDRLLRRQCDLTVIATCRTGEEFENVRTDKTLLPFAESLRVVRCSDYSEEELRDLANKTGNTFSPEYSDGTPGSVTLGLEIMASRFRTAPPIAHDIFRAILTLRIMQIFQPRAELVWAVLSKAKYPGLSRPDFHNKVEWLIKNDFLTSLEMGRLQPRHDAYLTSQFFGHDELNAQVEGFQRIAEIVEEHANGAELAGFGMVLLRTKDYQNAVRWLAKATKLLPSEPGVWFLFGVAVKQLGELEHAVNIFRSALKVAPEFPAALVELGNALSEKGDLESAIAAYNQALDLEPNMPLALLNLGVVRAKKDQGDEALSLFRKAINRQADFPEAYYEIGLALSEKQQFGEAIESYRLALKMRPDYLEALINLGGLLTETGKHDEAIATLEKAIQIDPVNALAFNNLGLAIVAKGDFKGAAACYRKALEQKPDLASALFNLGAALFDLGEDRDAIAAFRAGLKLEPNAGQILVVLGRKLIDAGNLDDAEEPLTRALDSEPHRFEALHYLGIVAAKRGNLDDSIRMFRESLSLNPAYQIAHKNLGVALHGKGAFEEAVQSFRRALELHKDDPDAKIFLAVALCDLGKHLSSVGLTEEARAAIGEAKTLKPDLDCPVPTP
jgi:tetratricopeptide (TPR) repeat protein